MRILIESPYKVLDLLLVKDAAVILFGNPESVLLPHLQSGGRVVTGIAEVALLRLVSLQGISIEFKVSCLSAKAGLLKV